MKKYLISFATSDYFNNQKRLNSSALQFGIDVTRFYHEDVVKKGAFFQENRSIFLQKRREGY